jgi:hypothetical protein
MIRNIRVLNRASIRLIAKGTVAFLLMVDNVLNTIVVILESCFVVENITLELLEVISREGMNQCGNGGHRVLARAEAEAALRTGQVISLYKITDHCITYIVVPEASFHLVLANVFRHIDKTGNGTETAA